MFVRTRSLLAILETKSWDLANLELPGYVCYGSRSGFTTSFATLSLDVDMCVLVANLGRNIIGFCTVLNKIKRKWKSEERCTAILFGTTVVMAVYAPVSKKSLGVYEECNASVVKVLREGPRGGAWNVHITVDVLTNMYDPCVGRDMTRTLTVSKKSCGMGS